jgi:hypothetical protein
MTDVSTKAKLNTFHYFLKSPDNGNCFNIEYCYLLARAHSSIVVKAVKALCYKLEGHRFDT